MPSTGLLSFLLFTTAMVEYMNAGCQCPQRAYFHFYRRYYVRILVCNKVSMPSTGLLSFLQMMVAKIMEKVYDVSMPSTGLLSFLRKNCKFIWRRYYCVNALNGLTFISTRTQSTFSISVPSVNALNGLTFISTLHPVRGKPREAACQCPQRAYFHFYGSLSEPLILAASESYFCK